MKSSTETDRVEAFTDRVLAVILAIMTAMVFNRRMGGPGVQLARVYALLASAFILIGGGRWSVEDALSRQR